MTVGFHRLYTVLDCNICWEPISGEETVAHDGPDGDKHPWHQSCIQEWLEYSDKCPSRCKITLDKDCLLFWQNKTIKELMVCAAKPMQEDLQKMLKIGVTMGVFMGIGYAANEPIGLTGTVLAPVGIATLAGGATAISEAFVLAGMACCKSLQIANLNRTYPDEESFEDTPII